MKALLAAALLLLAAVPAARAQDTTLPPRAADEARRRALHRGLEYLAQSQRKDGSWRAGGDGEAGVIGVTSLCLLAFMAQGHQEGRGAYADRGVIRKGVRYLMSYSLRASRRNPLVSDVRGYPVGYIYNLHDGDSKMHGHGYATQVLVLAYGSGREKTFPGLKQQIQLAIRVIESSQTITGGWGYEPRRASSHEGSITVTVVQALRLARDAGFVVDKEVHKRGLQYLRDSQKKDGSFKYSTMSDHSTAALTAAALTAMYGFGEYYSAAVRKGIDYLRDRYRNPRQIQWPFYGHYYAAQVFYRAGGEHWRFWRDRCIPFVVSRQDLSGAWDAGMADTLRRGSHGKAYATALSVLALSVQDGALPLFQR